MTPHLRAYAWDVSAFAPETALKGMAHSPGRLRGPLRNNAD